MMAELSISALLIRFVLGGAAVVLATIVAKIVGQKAGGIFAAFPAVYLAALLTQVLILVEKHLSIIRFFCRKVPLSVWLLISSWRLLRDSLFPKKVGSVDYQVRLVVGLSYLWWLLFFLLKDNKTSQQNGLNFNHINNRKKVYNNEW